MKRRRPAAPTFDVSTVPAELLAGACVELWAPDFDAAPFELHRRQAAKRRYAEARAEWLRAQGVPEDERVPPPLAAVPAVPWSYDVLAADDPERLAATLAVRGLPEDWTP